MVLDLKSLNKSINKAVAKAKEFTVPSFSDGHYLTKITNAVISESKNTGKYNIVLDYTFIEGDYTGKVKKEWLTLDPSTNKRFEITFSTLLRLGLDIHNAESLEEDLKSLIGRIVRIRLVTTVSDKDSTEYQNIRIEKVLGTDSETAAETKSTVEAVPEVAVEEDEEEEEEFEAPAEEAPAPKKRKSSKKGSEDPEESTEEEVEEEEEEVVEEESEDEDGETVVPGMAVSFTKKDGTELQGVVDSIDEEAGKVVVKATVNGATKKFLVSVDRLSAL